MCDKGLITTVEKCQMFLYKCWYMYMCFFLIIFLNSHLACQSSRQFFIMEVESALLRCMQHPILFFWIKYVLTKAQCLVFCMQIMTKFVLQLVLKEARVNHSIERLLKDLCNPLRNSDQLVAGRCKFVRGMNGLVSGMQIGGAYWDKRSAAAGHGTIVGPEELVVEV